MIDVKIPCARLQPREPVLPSRCCGADFRLLLSGARSYSGVFCAFTSPDVEDVCAVRFYVYTKPELPRDDPSSLRVHLCPDRPDEAEEMAVSESSEWGLVACVSTSAVLYIPQGARFKLVYEDAQTGEKQEGELVWYGRRCCTEFTLTVAGDLGEEPSADDPDEREKFIDHIKVCIMKGVGRRASRVQAVAKRAGIPEAASGYGGREEGESDYRLGFETRLKSEVRPNRPVMVLLERTPYAFTLAWRKPKTIDGDGDGDTADITHYSIELATCAPAGTYYPWQELWIGPGHAAPDWASVVAQRAAAKRQDQSGVADARAEGEARRAALEEALDAAQASAAAEEHGEHSSKAKLTSVKQRRGKAKAKKVAAPPDRVEHADHGMTQGEKPAAPDEIYTYSLKVDPKLFGRLRIRCWAEGEVRPSRYSPEVKLPRWVGKEEGDDSTRQVVEAEMKRYFESFTQHVTDGGKPAIHRIGNAPSRHTWGGDAPPPPPPPTDKERAKGVIMARVPTDVPRLPIKQTAGLDEAAKELAAFYREVGAVGGGGGSVFGLRIDHVLHAIVGTPTLHGQASPRRTVATLEEPLIALAEVAYHDVILPLIDTVAVLKPEWQFADEKVEGVIAQITTHTDKYTVVVHRLKELLVILLRLYEMLRQSQEEQHISFHVTHPDYSGGVKRQLKSELEGQICEALWQLSTRLLEMQLAILRPSAWAKARVKKNLLKMRSVPQPHRDRQQADAAPRLEDIIETAQQEEHAGGNRGEEEAAEEQEAIKKDQEVDEGDAAAATAEAAIAPIAAMDVALDEGHGCNETLAEVTYSASADEAARNASPAAASVCDAADDATAALTDGCAAAPAAAPTYSSHAAPSDVASSTVAPGGLPPRSASPEPIHRPGSAPLAQRRNGIETSQSAAGLLRPSSAHVGRNASTAIGSSDSVTAMPAPAARSGHESESATIIVVPQSAAAARRSRAVERAERMQNARFEEDYQARNQKYREEFALYDQDARRALPAADEQRPPARAAADRAHEAKHEESAPAKLAAPNKPHIELFAVPPASRPAARARAPPPLPPTPDLDPEEANRAFTRLIQELRPSPAPKPPKPQQREAAAYSGFNYDRPPSPVTPPAEYWASPDPTQTLERLESRSGVLGSQHCSRGPPPFVGVYRRESPGFAKATSSSLRPSRSAPMLSASKSGLRSRRQELVKRTLDTNFAAHATRGYRRAPLFVQLSGADAEGVQRVRTASFRASASPAQRSHPRIQRHGLSAAQLELNRAYRFALEPDRALRKGAKLVYGTSPV